MGQRRRLDPNPRFLLPNLGLAGWGHSGALSSGSSFPPVPLFLPSRAARHPPQPPQSSGPVRVPNRTLPRKSSSLLTDCSLQSPAGPGPRPQPHPRSRCCCIPPGAPHSWGTPSATAQPARQQSNHTRNSSAPEVLSWGRGPD